MQDCLAPFRLENLGCLGKKQPKRRKKLNSEEICLTILVPIWEDLGAFLFPKAIFKRIFNKTLEMQCGFHSEQGKERVNLIQRVFFTYAELNMANRSSEQTDYRTQINPVSAAVVLEPCCHEKISKDLRIIFSWFHGLSNTCL